MRTLLVTLLFSWASFFFFEQEQTKIAVDPVQYPGTTYLSSFLGTNGFFDGFQNYQKLKDYFSGNLYIDDGNGGLIYVPYTYETVVDGVFPIVQNYSFNTYKGIEIPTKYSWELYGYGDCTGFEVMLDRSGNYGDQAKLFLVKGKERSDDINLTWNVHDFYLKSNGDLADLYLNQGFPFEKVFTPYNAFYLQELNTGPLAGTFNFYNMRIEDFMGGIFGTFRYSHDIRINVEDSYLRNNQNILMYHSDTEQGNTCTGRNLTLINRAHTDGHGNSVYIHNRINVHLDDCTFGSDAYFYIPETLTKTDFDQKIIDDDTVYVNGAYRPAMINERVVFDEKINMYRPLNKLEIQRGMKGVVLLKAPNRSSLFSRNTKTKTGLVPIRGKHIIQIHGTNNDNPALALVLKNLRVNAYEDADFRYWGAGIMLNGRAPINDTSNYFNDPDYDSKWEGRYVLYQIEMIGEGVQNRAIGMRDPSYLYLVKLINTSKGAMGYNNAGYDFTGRKSYLFESCYFSTHSSPVTVTAFNSDWEFYHTTFSGINMVNQQGFIVENEPNNYSVGSVLLDDVTVISGLLNSFWGVVYVNAPGTTFNPYGVWIRDSHLEQKSLRGITNGWPSSNIFNGGRVENSTIVNDSQTQVYGMFDNISYWNIINSILIEL